MMGAGARRPWKFVWRSCNRARKGERFISPIKCRVHIDEVPMKNSWYGRPISLAAALSVFLLLFSAAARAQGNWQAEWEKILAAAEKEGALNVGGPPGDTYRLALMEVFQ